MSSAQGSPQDALKRSNSSSTASTARSRNTSVPSIFASNQTASLAQSARARPQLDNIAVPEPRPDAAAAAADAATLKPRSASVSEAQLPVLSPDAADRVFPIRSYVTVTPSPTAKDSYFSNNTAASKNAARQNFSASSRHNASTDTIPEGEPLPTPSDVLSDSETDAASIASLRQSYYQSSNPTKSPDQNNLQATGQGWNILTETESNRSGSTARRTEFDLPPGQQHQGGTYTPSEMSARSVRDPADDPGGFLTARFKHVVTEGGHAVITGRDGETLQRCEDEPIHIPGAIQSFGLLVALEEQEEGKLVVRVVSENSKRILGYSPKHLFKLESFTDLLSDEQTDNLLDHIDFVKEGDDDVETNGPEVFTMSIRDPARRSRKLWTAIHINTNHSNLIICEFELEDDKLYPLTPANEETPEPPEDTLSSDPTAEELRESTEAKSRPLRVLRSARKRKGEAAAMEVFNIMSQVQEQLGEAPNLEAFLKVLVGVVKELTGFHRVMIYQFDSSWNGRVVTELVDPRATKDLYKGLHFPASDIPKQARDLYKINRVRLLYDRDQETARLVCRTVQDLETPLDLTHAYLRAMSPIHVKYLRNMAVRSSMSISINAFNELWGLISCHCYGSKGTRVSFPIRKMCRLVGDSASRNIERLSYASRLQARKLINTAPTKKNPSGYIIASSDDLLKLFDADFGLLSINEETKILGKLEATQEALAMLEYLKLKRYGSVITSQDIRFDFPDLHYPPGFKTIAGLLLVPLTTSGQDFILFLRRGQLREVKWAGNPYEKFVKEGTEGYLEPRKSFKTWSEKVVGKCREWTEEEIETAAVLCLVYGKFIEVWRQKEAALQNSQLTKLLLANSAHEVRTPLNAIINYLEIAMEGALDEETRENLSRSHSASKSLIYVINDLLDLTKTEAGCELIHEEPFDLPHTFQEATELFQGDAKRKNIEYFTNMHPDVPAKALGDQRRIHRAISNIIANAVQATSKGRIDVEMLVAKRYDGRRVDIEVIVTDTGAGMSSEKLDTLFAELEQVQAENSALIEEAIAPEAKSLGPVKDDPQTLGLGLAVVSRIVRNMNGQLRLKSEEGKGSRFVLQLPFNLPDELATDDKALEAESVATADPFAAQSEVTLVAKNLEPDDTLTSSGNGTPARRNSVESLRSLASAQSQASRALSLESGRSGGSGRSGRSDVDRLIEAMQEPFKVSSQPQSPLSFEDSRSRSGMQQFSRSPHSHDGVVPASRLEKVPAHRRTSRTDKTPVGMFNVQGSNQYGRAVRMPDDGMTGAHAPAGSQSVVSETSQSTERAEELTADRMHVLIAEDDPINAKIIQKRLRKAEHETYLTVNGEECASIYGERPATFDAVLMDMQMPIVDGLSSAKMIRSYEKAHPELRLSPRALLNGRVPIIAVSASLIEKERATYIEAGFDGWILKPVNFKRLAVIMSGIVDPSARSENVYRKGEWERGGWFSASPQENVAASTKPSSDRPVHSKTADIKDEAQANQDRGGGEEAGAAANDTSPETEQAVAETKSELDPPLRPSSA